MSAVNQVYDRARAVLDVIVECFTACDVELPARRLVAPGRQVPIDCEQLAVVVLRTFTYSGDLATEVNEQISPHVGFGMRAIELGIALIRPVPTMYEDGSPPDVESVEEAARVILEDGRRLPLCIVQAVKDGTLPGCHDVLVGEWQAAEEQGGYCGGALTVVLGY